MASIFDKLTEENNKAQLAIVEAQNAPLANVAPLPISTPKTPCACEQEAKLERINTRLSIAVNVLALLFFIIGILSFLRKTVA